MSESASINIQKKKTWSSAAIQALLGLIKELDLLAKLDARRQRNRVIFEDLTTRLAEEGYTFTWEEVKNQWKYLKRQYYKVKKQLMTSGMGAEGRHWPPFSQLDELLGTRPRTTALVAEGLQSFPTMTVEVNETSFTDSEGTGIAGQTRDEDADDSLVVSDHDHEESSTTSDSWSRARSRQRTSKHKRKRSGSFEDRLFSHLDEERKLRREELNALQQESKADREMMTKFMSSITRLADSMQK